MIFTSQKLDKLDELVYAVNNLTINDAIYYESSTATTNDTQAILQVILKQLLTLETKILNKKY